MNDPTWGGTGLRSGARKSQAVSSIVSREPSDLHFIYLFSLSYLILLDFNLGNFSVSSIVFRESSDLFLIYFILFNFISFIDLYFI